MSHEILMPALSPTMTSGTLAKWLVSTGDTIAEGDMIAEVETDKATMEIEATASGIITVLQGEGIELAVGDVIAVAGDSVDESASPVATSSVAEDPAPAQSPEPAVAKPIENSPAVPAPAKAPMPELKAGTSASPLAKRLGEILGVDLNSIKGTGVKGKIVKADVLNAAQEGSEKPAPIASAAIKSEVLSLDDPIFKMLPDYEAIPNSNMRKTIASRLTESARDIPHFNLQVDVQMDKLMELRKELNGLEEADYKLSVNDFVIKAVALALSRCPDSNAAYTNEAVLKFKQVDMAIAVSIEGGLITPIIKDAASKGLATISKEAKELAGRAREGKLAPEEYQGGTFTISNLGMFGIKSFNSIINPPQGGILSVGAGEKRPVVDANGELGVATMMTISLAVDHRCIDGTTGAELIQEIKTLIEDPIALML